MSTETTAENDMTLQEIFDTAVGGVLEQGRLSATSTGSCRYRSPDGAKCAAGQLIPDDKYYPRLEGAGANSEAVREALGEPNADEMGLISQLQRAHDDSAQAAGCNKLDEFKERAREVARIYNLDTSVLEAHDE